MDGLLHIETAGNVATVALNDPKRRNALGLSMFDALDEALRVIAADEGVHVMLLCGRGKAFCSGFDLAAAADDPPVMATFIERLSRLLRGLRRLPAVTVAAVHGAAIAGGCAIVSACDLVVVSRAARLGYPVHGLGVSPAVTIPTLLAAGHGTARAMLAGGELVDGATALRIGLADRLCAPENVLQDATALCERIAGHGPTALRATKAWLNELEGSLDDRLFDGPADATAELARTEAAQGVLVRALRAMRGTS